MSQFTTLLYYKYIDIEDPAKLMEDQRTLCQSLGLKGRIIIAKEGINGTVEGNGEAAEEYIKNFHSISGFENVKFKKSYSSGQNFPRLSIKVRKEIVSTHLEVFDQLGPHRNLTGKYLSAEQLHEWIHDKNKEFYIVDMRNDYEYKVGHFYNSILPKNLSNFRDLPKILPEIEHLKDKTVVTVCTGGVRCEKASGFLLKHGFEDVYQLHDGIVTYMEKYPNEDFLGKLYVFDERVVMGFNTEDEKHVVVGKCCKCGQTSENLINWKEDGKRHYDIVCENCIKKLQLVLD
jgi:UPF0176 protein